MATEIATLVAKLEVQMRDFQRDMDKAKRALDDLDDSTSDLDQTTRRTDRRLSAMSGTMKALAGTAVAGAVLGFAKSAVSEFSKLEESTNAVEVVFGDAADTIKSFGESSAETVGLAQSSFQQLASGTGGLLQQFGFDAQRAADETVNLTTRASDMASVFNTDVADALGAINSALRGETEPIRRFNVDVSEASLSAYAMAQGIDKSVSSMSQAEKAALRLNVIMEQTEVTAGDFANTSGSLANRQRILSERFRDTQAAVGEELAPAMLTLLEAGNDLLPLFSAIAASVSSLIGKAAALAKPVAELVGWMEEQQVATNNATESQGALSLAWELASTNIVDRFAMGIDIARSRMIELGGETAKTSDITKDIVTSTDTANVVFAEFGDTSAIVADEVQRYTDKQHAMADAMDRTTASTQSLIRAIGSGSWLRRASEQIQINRFFGPGGAARDEDRVDGYQTGGIVPGPLGRPRLALVHGGEQVLTPQQRVERSVTINQYGNMTTGGDVTSETAMALLLAGVNEHVEFRGISDIRG